MNDPFNPFDRSEDDEKKPAGGGGGWIWFIIAVLAVILLIAWLSGLNPGALDSGDSQMRLLYLGLLLLLVGPGIVRVWRQQGSTTVKYAAIWVGIFAVLAVGYSYRHELTDAKNRVTGELMPHQAVTEASGDVTIRRSATRHFYVEAMVDGEPVKFLVDTGASDVVLSPADAKRLRIDLSRLTFNRVYSTANGVGTGASIRLGEIRIGPIAVRDVGASVNGKPMSHSLLGMSYLNRLRGYEVSRDTLTLKP